MTHKARTVILITIIVTFICKAVTSLIGSHASEPADIYQQHPPHQEDTLILWSPPIGPVIRIPHDTTTILEIYTPGEDIAVLILRRTESGLEAIYDSEDEAVRLLMELLVERYDSKVRDMEAEIKMLRAITPRIKRS